MNEEQQNHTSGYDRIVAERQRQIESEGWSLDHDDGHGTEILMLAAVSYRDATGDEAAQPALWPWDSAWWKPKSRLRNLVRAGALYQAAADVAERAHDFEKRDSLREHVFTCATLIDSVPSSQG